MPWWGQQLQEEQVTPCRPLRVASQSHWAPLALGILKARFGWFHNDSGKTDCSHAHAHTDFNGLKKNHIRYFRKMNAVHHFQQCYHHTRLLSPHGSSSAPAVACASPTRVGSGRAQMHSCTGDVTRQSPLTASVPASGAAFSGKPCLFYSA